MPKFELAEKNATIDGKATFEKESDYMVITLNSDELKKNHMVHVIHGKKLIAKKMATAVKNAEIDERDQETVVTIDKDRVKIN
jgi:hypothetical protein